uniref:Uncharacterized protein n=1 Tax=Rhizophora mucronata TaxID=61149 RepID=A0A2P2QX20_RHIMU
MNNLIQSKFYKKNTSISISYMIVCRLPASWLHVIVVGLNYCYG